MIKQFKIQLDSEVYSVDYGRVAKQANAAILWGVNEVVLLVTATMSHEPREGVDFFPLMVDFEERMYAAGQFPGGFIKREGRPSEDAVLISRRIDRTLRPIFPKDFINDVQVVVTALSVDRQTQLDVHAINAGSLALQLSDIPFPNPVAAVRIGRVDGNFLLNPTKEQLDLGDLNLLVSGTYNKINMIEDESLEVSEEVIAEGLEIAHKYIRLLIDQMKSIAVDNGKSKVEDYFKAFQYAPELYKAVEDLLIPELNRIYPISEKLDFYQHIRLLRKKYAELFADKFTEDELKELNTCIDKIIKTYVRKRTLAEKLRVDGRGPDDIRAVSCEIGLLPRVHGSGLFTRGQTQVLSAVTLGSHGDQQTLDTMMLEGIKRYVHHYNFPPYSVGEAKPMRSAGRRDIGHGALAEKAVECMIPSTETFGYAIRVVSEVLESNASSSMASVCASTLALMDAGVPIKAPIAGVSTGLVWESDDQYVLLSDLCGFEDFNGDMDFKIAGTRTGVTAIQLDVKLEGLSLEICKEVLQRARSGRLAILDQMSAVISEPRPSISPYAPLLVTIKIPVDKIGMVIGPQGKNIKKICLDYECTVDIEDDGTTHVSGTNHDLIDGAVRHISSMVAEVEEGQTYKGKVTRVTTFGAFIEVLPGKEGLLHISEMAEHRVERVEDEMNVGDFIDVIVKEIDSMNRVNLLRVGVKAQPRPQRSSGGKPNFSNRRGNTGRGGGY